MGSPKERHPHRKRLQARADELGNQQTLGLSIAQSVQQEVEVTGQLDVDKVLVASKRFERAHADSAWIEAILESPLRSKQILKIWKRKDEISRGLDGSND